MKKYTLWPFEYHVDSGQVRIFDVRAHLDYLGVVYIDGHGKPQIEYSNSNTARYLPVQDALKLLGFYDYEIGV